METTAGISKAMLSRRQLPEILRCLRNDIIVQLEHNPSCRFGTDRNVELGRIMIRSCAAPSYAVYSRRRLPYENGL